MKPWEELADAPTVFGGGDSVIQPHSNTPPACGLSIRQGKNALAFFPCIDYISLTQKSHLNASARKPENGAVAQSVERSPEKAGVGGSIPPCPTCKEYVDLSMAIRMHTTIGALGSFEKEYLGWPRNRPTAYLVVLAEAIGWVLVESLRGVGVMLTLVGGKIICQA